MTTRRFTSEDPDLDRLYADVADNDLQPLWTQKGLLSPQPRVRTVPFRWRAEDLHALGERSGRLVPIDRGGDRRVLACANPGLGGAPYACSSLWAAVQFLGPGECAPAHRHTPAALRFVLDGEGVWTLVDGDPVQMTRGDLILTPSWTFHEHHNPGAQPMIWMDVLDLPVIEALDAVFYEDGPSEEVEPRTDTRSASERLFGGGPGLRPTTVCWQRKHSPLLVYRWKDTDAALRAQLEVTGAAKAEIRYTDPTRGTDVMPTMRCEMLRLLADHETDPHRQTGHRVAGVLAGSGQVTIGDETFDIATGDIFVVPSWTAYQLKGAEQLDVFSTSDAPVLEALGVFRESNG